MTEMENWQVEVAYATPACQEVILVSVRPGVTIEQVIRASGILRIFPEIDLSRHQVGIFGEVVPVTDPVHDRDRVEIYRPLIADPKAARQRRAAGDGKRPGGPKQK